MDSLFHVSSPSISFLFPPRPPYSPYIPPPSGIVYFMIITSTADYPIFFGTYSRSPRVLFPFGSPLHPLSAFSS